MNSQINNPMSEYLLKIQLIIRNSEFKNKEEADKYETAESKINGVAYIRAKEHTDIFESYKYNDKHVYKVLLDAGYDENTAVKLMKNPQMIPHDIKEELLSEARELFILKYDEPNKYYVNLTGKPFKGNKTVKPDPVFYISDEFYDKYKSDTILVRQQAVHELPVRYQELYMLTDEYAELIKNNPDALYLRYIGNSSIPIEVSRKARDGDIMKINTNKLSTYHPVFGNVIVSPEIIHAYTEIYRSTRDYVYQTLRGDFNNIYANYNSLIRYLTIYMSIGASINEFQHKSTNMMYMNNTTANNLFVLYGLPSVIMEGKPMIDFLKKFRLLLMDKGTNVVYRVKDLIGYQYTDIYTLVMVKQQVFDNGIPRYIYNSDGTKTPVTRIVFRRLGTSDDNTSYFRFRESKKEYDWEEIASGDPRWWNTPETERMLYETNYTLSNSKYIQLSTHMSLQDVWWQCVIFLRGLLDRKVETQSTMININRNVGNGSKISVFDAVLSLINIMHWQMIDANGNYPLGELYNGDCVDMLFNGMNGFKANPLIPGHEFKVASFNYEAGLDPRYAKLSEFSYLEPDIFIPMVNKVLDQSTNNVGEELMHDILLIYKYLENKVRDAVTIYEFRECEDAYNLLFLVDPNRMWYDQYDFNKEDVLCEKYHISNLDLIQFKQFFPVESIETEPDIIVTYHDKDYRLYFNTILNQDMNYYEYDGEFIFKNREFMNAFIEELEAYKNNTIQSSTLPAVIKLGYKDIIIDKINIDIGASNLYGPTTFETLLMTVNPELYDYINSQRKDNPDEMIMTLRAIIKALEDYSNTSLHALASQTLGEDVYINILKEVISYFKSYMVEFTKEEFVRIFGGILDNGGNCDMLTLYDDIPNIGIEMSPMDSLTIFDVSYSDISEAFVDDIHDLMYDEAMFRIETTYGDLKEMGYEIWYDDGKRITRTPINIRDETDVVVNIVSHDNTYRAIVNIDNIDIIPPNYIGNGL